MYCDIHIKKLEIVLIILLMNIVSLNIANASGLSMVGFQGFLTDSEGRAVIEGSYTFTFSIWDGESENTATKLWEETQILPVTKGVYGASLGSVNPFPYTLTFSQPCYLGVQIDHGEYLKNEGSFIPLLTTWTAFRSKTSEGRIVKQVNHDYTVSQNDDILLVSGGININIPSPESSQGRILSIIKNDNNNPCIVKGYINSISQELPLSEQNDQISLVSDGNKWIVLGFSVLDRIETDQKANTVDVYSKIDIDNDISTLTLSVSDATITNTIISDSLSVTGLTKLSNLTVDETSEFSSVNAHSIKVTQGIMVDDIVSQTMTANTISITNTATLNTDFHTMHSRQNSHLIFLPFIFYRINIIL
jgi:hypothetical protein